MDFELPCPQCGCMVPAPQLQQHIKAEHPDGGTAAGSGSGGAAAEAEPRYQRKPQVEGEKPKLNPPRKQVAAFAALKDAVKEANKSVKAARAANMPDASRPPPSAAAGQGKRR